MKTYAVRIVVITLALAGCLAPVTWAAEQDSNPSLAADLGLGLASFACSVPYGAVKVSTAILGGIMGASLTSCPDSTSGLLIRSGTRRSKATTS